MSFATIVSEGNLIPADLLAQIAAGEAEGQQSADFGLDKARRLTDEIAAAWADVKVYWEAFQRSLRRLRDDDPATTVTRERWVLPLLETLGYKLVYQPAATVVGGRSYAVSHRAGGNDGAPPVHIEGIRRSLDQRGPAGRPRLSPHALVQEYLNSTEQLWGLVTNGERLRLLRDSSRTVRPVYVEFDLRAMVEGERFSEFALLYRLLHRTRLPQSHDDASRCLLERYHQQAIEAGGRVRDGLRDGVELALRALGAGLLQHADSEKLREHVTSEQLDALDYYRQLLRLVYRLLFLMVAEERSLIGGSEAALRIYREHYSVGRLRRLAENSIAATARHGDLWLGLLATFRILEDDEAAQALGVAALDGDLFGPRAMPDLATARLDNSTLLRAVRALSLYRDPQSKTLRRVNYAALDVEELGSVYESLLDYRPVVGRLPGENLSFALVSGTERKTTGSYYTRPELVHELIKSALEPVLAERVKEAESGARWRRSSADDLPAADRVLPPERQATIRAILALRVVDPAAGSDHFLLAAARRLGRELTRVRSGEEQPAPTEFRRAVRDVIARCIYAVDLNPLAMDLCKVALWLESLEPGKPLSFLDSKVRWGNSLVGATRELVAQGIPDDAYKPVTGDDKAAASVFRKRNKREREGKQSGQISLGLEFVAPASASPTTAARALNAMPDDSVAAVRAKARQYEQLRAGAYSDMVRFNLWTAAFFSPLTDASDVAVPTNAALEEWAERPSQYNVMVGHAFALAQQIGFFHWELEFPEVFPDGEAGGFDVVLGNPPWERIKLQEQEHFVDVPEIAGAANKAAREKMIVAWRNGDERQRARIVEFDAAKYRAEAESRFVRASGRFPLTAVGDVNTYALFAEHSRDLLAPTGRSGIIVPTGIATDDTTKAFFGDLVNKQSLVKLLGFINEEGLFPGVLHNFKFCTLVTAGYNIKIEQADFSFLCFNFRQAEQLERHFTMSREDFTAINPNTRTCAVFRTQVDAELTKKIYRRVPVLFNERTNQNPWGASFVRMFDMSNDSSLFKNEPGEGLLPLYEGKMMYQFDHRFASYESFAENERVHMLPETLIEKHQDPNYAIKASYYVDREEVLKRIKEKTRAKWLVGIRGIASSGLARIITVSALPICAVGNSVPVITAVPATSHLTCLLATLNSIVVDFVSKQKIGGANLNFFILEQLPVIPPERFSAADIAFIVPRVVELVYTARDIKAFAEDVWAEGDDALRAELLRRNGECNADADPALFAPRDGFPLPPYRWNEERRALARAELDARIARLYGLSRDELRYILDPHDVYGPEFPGETFRVLKEKELRLYGEFRTRRLVLEAWDREEQLS